MIFVYSFMMEHPKAQPKVVGSRAAQNKNTCNHYFTLGIGFSFPFDERTLFVAFPGF